MLVTTKFNGPLMAHDAQARGWDQTTFAAKAEVNPMRVSRFLRGVQQSPKTAKLLADALGKPLRRYQVPLGANVPLVRSQSSNPRSPRQVRQGRNS